MNLVAHIYGVAVAPAELLVVDALGEGEDGIYDTVHLCGDEGQAFIGVEVPVTEDGIVVTDAVRAEFTRAIAELPPGFADEVRELMHAHACSDPERAAWKAGFPAPKFHVCAYDI